MTQQETILEYSARQTPCQRIPYGTVWNVEEGSVLGMWRGLSSRSAQIRRLDNAAASSWEAL